MRLSKILHVLMGNSPFKFKRLIPSSPHRSKLLARIVLGVVVSASYMKSKITLLLRLIAVNANQDSTSLNTRMASKFANSSAA